MSEVVCPLCRKKIHYLLARREKDGAIGWGFCPTCNGELSEEQVKKLTFSFRKQEGGGGE